jgi:hypothetical protein
MTAPSPEQKENDMSAIGEILYSIGQDDGRYTREPGSDLLKAARAEHASLVAERDQARAEVERLTDAINWALGVTMPDGSFIPAREEGQGSYYWRPELMRRAGLEYDGSRFVLSSAPSPSPEPRT